MFLQAQYGMNDDGSFNEQHTRNIQNAVDSGELTVVDYYDKQIDLKIAESQGIDDESSCLKGSFSILPIRFFLHLLFFPFTVEFLFLFFLKILSH